MVDLTGDEKSKFLLGIEMIKVNTMKIAKELETQNLKSNESNEAAKTIATHLEHINWNLGKIFATMSKDKKIMKAIEDAELKKENKE